MGGKHSKKMQQKTRFSAKDAQRASDVTANWSGPMVGAPLGGAVASSAMPKGQAGKEKGGAKSKLNVDQREGKGAKGELLPGDWKGGPPAPDGDYAKSKGAKAAYLKGKFAKGELFKGDGKGGPAVLDEEHMKDGAEYENGRGEEPSPQSSANSVGEGDCGQDYEASQGGESRSHARAGRDTLCDDTLCDDTLGDKTVAKRPTEVSLPGKTLDVESKASSSENVGPLDFFPSSATHLADAILDFFPSLNDQFSRGPGGALLSNKKGAPQASGDTAKKKSRRKSSRPARTVVQIPSSPVSARNGRRTGPVKIGRRSDATDAMQTSSQGREGQSNRKRQAEYTDVQWTQWAEEQIDMAGVVASETQRRRKSETRLKKKPKNPLVKKTEVDAEDTEEDWFGWLVGGRDSE